MLLSLLIFARSRRRASSSHSLSTLNVLASSSARRMIVAALCLWSTAAVRGVLGVFSDIPVTKLVLPTSAHDGGYTEGSGVLVRSRVQPDPQQAKYIVTDVLVNLAGDRLSSRVDAIPHNRPQTERSAVVPRATLDLARLCWLRTEGRAHG